MAKKRFKTRFLPLTVTILMLLVLLALGFWQMSRSGEKQALIDSYQSAPELPPIGVEDIPEDWQSMRFREVKLEGHYDAGHQLLLENQIQNRQSGLMVLTPFKLHGKKQYVMVNRGWISRSADLSVLPEIDVDTGLRKIRGLLNHPPGVGIKMGSLNDSMSGWPKSIPYFDYDWVSLQIGGDIKPWVILLADDQPDGYARHWQPSVRMTPDKHMGYAFQWFSLAVALIFLYIIASFKSDEAESDEQD